MEDPVQELENQLAATTDLRQKVDILNALARELRDVDAQRALTYSQMAYELATTGEPYPKGRVFSLTRLAESSAQLGQYDAALAQAFAALAAIEEDGQGELKPEILRVISGTYEHLGNYPDALTYNLTALDVCQKVGDHIGEALTLNLLGIVYNRLGDYRQELATYEKAIQIFREAGWQRHVAILLNNIAMAYHSLGNAQEALEYSRQSLEIAQEMGLGMLEATVLGTMGDSYLQMADYPQTLSYFRQALELSRRIGFKYIEMYSLLNIGKACAALQQTDDALAALRQALAIAEEIETKADLFECHRVLAEVHRQRGDSAAALGHYEQYHTIKEAVFNEEADRRLKNLQVVHSTETARKAAEIYRLRNVELEREITRREQAEEALRGYAVELERQNAELEAFAHTVAHDLKGPLNALRLSSDLPEDEFGQMPPAEQYDLLRTITRCGQIMNNLIDELLLLSSVRGKEVRLQALDMGLFVAQALQRLTYWVEQSQAEVVLPERWPTVLGYGPWVEEVWVNYVSNALKYGGRPPRVELGSTIQGDGWVRFWVHDNGAGLSPEEQELLFTPFERLHQVRTEGHGLGLSIVRRIVEKLGGRVGVSSIPHGAGAGPAGDKPGTIFYFDLPEALP